MSWFDSDAFKMTLIGLSAALVINTCGRKVANFAWVWLYTFWNRRRPKEAQKMYYKWVCTGKDPNLGCPSIFLFKEQAHQELMIRKNVKCPRCRHDLLFATGVSIVPDARTDTGTSTSTQTGANEEEKKHGVDITLKF